jgi:MFS family permease
MAAGCLIAVAVAAVLLLCGPEVQVTVGEPRRRKIPDVKPARRRPPRRVVALGVLAFLLFLAEGSAMDWCSLHAQRHLHASPQTGALVVGAFVAALTVGRFSMDRIAQRIGPVRVVRWGSAAAAIGLLTVILSAALPLTIVGWIVFGFGLSGGIPQVFTAAGNSPGDPGRALTDVVGFGYIAIVAGPGVIGWIAEVSSLGAAMLVPLAAILVCVLTASVVAGRSVTLPSETAQSCGAA